MKKIPDFKTVEEIQHFWETHDFTEFTENTREADISFARPTKAQVTFRLESKDIEKIKHIADEKGLNYTALIRMWVREKLSA